MARLTLAAFLLIALAGCGSSKKTAAPTPAPPLHAEGDIVFSVFEDMPVTQCGGLFAVRPSTGKIRALAGFGRTGTVLQPTFSPDGHTFTVASFTDTGGDLPGEWVYRFDQRSGRLSRLAKSDAPFAPVWSPRSDALLVLRAKGSDFALHAVDVPSGKDHEILRPGGPILGFSWSSDGAKIAHTLTSERTHYDVWTTDRDGSNQRLLVRRALDPAWLPDGSSIAYWSLGSTDQSESTLKIARTDGTQARAVPGGPFLRPFQGIRMFDPHGRRMFLLKQPQAGSKSDYNDGDLVVQDVDANKPGAIVARNVIPVQWSPNGERILILRPRTIDGETVFVVAAIDPDGGDERAVAVIDEQDVNGALSFPAWQPGTQSIATASRDYAPQPSVRACAPRIAKLRDRLASR